MSAGAVTIIVNSIEREKERKRLILERRRERELLRRTSLARTRRVRRKLF